LWGFSSFFSTLVLAPFSDSVPAFCRLYVLHQQETSLACCCSAPVVVSKN
jgi:hypothetical protein